MSHSPIDIEKLCTKCAIIIDDPQKKLAIVQDLHDIVKYAYTLKEIEDLLPLNVHTYANLDHLRLRQDDHTIPWKSQKQDLMYTSGDENNYFVLPL